MRQGNASPLIRGTGRAALIQVKITKLQEARRAYPFPGDGMI